MKRFFRFLVLGVLAALTVAPAAAAQGVNQSPNMNLLFNSQNPDNATNSDMAFWGNRVYQGDYSGFRIFDISNPAAPVLLGNVRCRGVQGDPVVWQNRWLFVAVDRTMTGPNCGATDTAAHDDPRGWEGVRIFDVSNPAAVRQIGAVYTDCGAHTITLHPATAAGVLHLYVSSYPLRPGPTCGDTEYLNTANPYDTDPGNPNSPTHGVIQVIEVPLNNPAGARDIGSAPVTYPGDADNLMVWGQHGLPPAPSPPGPPGGELEPAARACHDMTVFVELNIIGAACAEQAQLWRIRANGIPDSGNPIWVFDDRQDANGATRNPADQDVAVDFWHSFTFTWDGKLLNTMDESFGTGCPPVTNITEPGVAGQSDTGRSYFLDVATGAKRSHFMIPRTEASPCYNSAHLGTFAPTIGRYLLVNAWYQGGADVIDATNPANPTEVAWWDFLPAGPTGSDNWAHYWYENTVGDNNGMWTYATDGFAPLTTGRGFEAFRVTMPAQDIALSRLNPQTQESRITCRVTARGASLRAGARRTIALGVTARGVAVLPGQGFRAHLSLRGAGVARTVETNAAGNARVRVRPTRRGTLRIRVHNDENLVGCRTQRGVRAALRPAAPAGGRLTGSR